jgi:hypothetical protein
VPQQEMVVQVVARVAVLPPFTAEAQRLLAKATTAVATAPRQARFRPAAAAVQEQRERLVPVRSVARAELVRPPLLPEHL